MTDILKASISQMPGLSFDCSCGRHHSVGIRFIAVGSSCLPKTAEFAKEFGATKIFLMADRNTYAVCGEKTETLLRNSGFSLHTYIFPNTAPLVPDEAALGRLLVEIDPEDTLIVSVGSGTLNDLARMISFKTHIPYFIVGTAPSMDGYASPVSPLIIDGFKTTYEAVTPTGIVADTSIMKDAPMEMIQSGFGDILGKYTALTDWMLAKTLKGEYYCETSVRLMESAVRKCVENKDGILKRDETAVGMISEALILSGLAMMLVGNSRPASGAEHHMAHFWEMDALKKHEPHPLHGNAVGAAAVVSASVYELMCDFLPDVCRPPKPETLIEILHATGAPDGPKALGISRELFHSTVLHAMEIRVRFTILRLADEKGRLAEIADTLTRRFYGD